MSVSDTALWQVQPPRLTRLEPEAGAVFAQFRLSAPFLRGLKLRCQSATEPALWRAAPIPDAEVIFCFIFINQTYIL